jgi:intermediate peptidase
MIRWRNHQVRNANIENVSSFLNSLSKTNYPLASKEFDSLLNIKKQMLNQNDLNFEAWDRYYYSQYIEPLLDKSISPLKKTQNNLSSYFSVGTVFSGLSDVFYSMYGVRFEIQDTIPGEVWHKDVRKLAVVHESEGVIGTIYCDLFQRESQDIPKYDNAAHFTVRCCRRIDNDEPIVKEQNWRMNNDKHERLVSSNGKTRKYQIPIVVLVTSFSPLRQGIPSLMDLSEIETLFHEMGHAMHCKILLTKQCFHRLTFNTLVGRE